MFQVQILSNGGFDSIMIFLAWRKPCLKHPGFRVHASRPKFNRQCILANLASLAYLACADHTLPQRNQQVQI